MEFTKIQIRTRQKMSPSDAKKLVEYVNKNPNIINGVVIKRNIGCETEAILTDAGILFKDGVGTNENDIEDAMASLQVELSNMINSNNIDDDELVEESSNDDLYMRDYISGCVDEFYDDIEQPSPKFTSVDIRVINERLRFKDAKKINETALNHPTKLIGLICTRGVSKKAMRTLVPSVEVVIPNSSAPKDIESCKQVVLRHFDDITERWGSSNVTYDDSMEFLRLSNNFEKMSRIILEEIYIPTLSIDVITASVKTALRCAAKIHNISLSDAFQKYPNSALAYIGSAELRKILDDLKYSYGGIWFDVQIDNLSIDTIDKDPDNWKISASISIDVYHDNEKIHTTIKKFKFVVG